jgi:hypothetical protein
VSGRSTATLPDGGPYALDADAATVTLTVSGTRTARARGAGIGSTVGPEQAAARVGAGQGVPGTDAGVGWGSGSQAALDLNADTGGDPGSGSPPRSDLSSDTGAAVLRIAPGHGTVRASADPARRLAVPADGGEVLAEGPHVAAAAAYAADVAAFVTAAQALGVGLTLLDRTVAYVKQRSQFGAPIGSFQAVKHRLADTLIRLEFARPLLYGAALTMAPADVAAAKVTAGEAAYFAARTALQLHGAVGYTEELDLSLWLRKARPLRDAWGTPAQCRARVLDARGAPRCS